MEAVPRPVAALCAAALLTSCGSSGSGDPRSAGLATVTVTATPTPTPNDTAPAGPTGPTDVDVVTAIPGELVGTWQSVDQGSAEDLIELQADGTYRRAMVLMQQRPSGVFGYSVGTTGRVEVNGTTLRLLPTSGNESLTDPDAPGDSYTDRPVADLTPEEYRWSVSDGSLWLDGQYGVVEFRPSGP